MEVQNRLYNSLRYYESNSDVIDFVTFTNIKENNVNYIDCFNSLIEFIEKDYSNFKFFVVFTLEGNGVCHCIFINCPYNKDKLMSLWNSLTGSYIVDKQRFKEGTESKLGCYLNNQKEYLRYDHSLDFFVDNVEVLDGGLTIVHEKVV